MSGKKHIYIGTNTKNGVYRAEYADGRLENVTQIYEIKNPSYISRLDGSDILFALSERGDGADIYSLNIGNEDCRLNSTAKVPGRGLCHISLSPDGKTVFGACYESGHIFSVSADGGKLDKIISVFDHNDNKFISNKKARAHCIKTTYCGKYAIAVDLGLDALIVYSLESDGSMTYKSHYNFEQGTGPRHIAFGKNDSSVLYLISEYSNELFTFKFTEGNLELLNRVSSLPSDFSGKSHGAAVKISPDGKKVAVSNRVENADGIISIFEIADDKLPADMKTVTSGACFPRDFEFTPDSEYIIAANQVSSRISIMSAKTGSVVSSYDISQPVCIIF